MEIKGEEIKVDTDKYSNFINASIHLFRNMVDHGIETEDERIEKTKPQTGNINVSFKLNGETFEIVLKDDGRRIDPDKVREKALEKGLKSKEELSKIRPALSGDEIMEHFKIQPGPKVGIIMKALYEQRINDGEVSKEEAFKLAEETYKNI